MDGGQDSYMQQRSTAIESIESTISELGQIFGQLAHMVAEQRDTVQRIDSDVYDVADNVSGAQRELLKYYASVSSNRWLMLKIFGVSNIDVGRFDNFTDFISLQIGLDCLFLNFHLGQLKIQPFHTSIC